MPDNRHALAGNLFALADRNLIGIDQLARAAGIAPAAVSAMVCCERDATREEISAIARVRGAGRDAPARS